MRWKWPCYDQARGRAFAFVVPLAALLTLGVTAATAAEPGQGRHRPNSLAPVQKVAVFGPDDRVALPPSLRPLREVLGVLFNVRQRTVCSAFCVGPALIGTAAHCLFKTKGEKTPRLADFWFARNYDAIRDYSRIAGYETGTAGQNILAGSVRLSTVPPIDATKDWAFVRLASPVCNKGALEIQALAVDEIIQESKAGHVYQVSYHKDFKQWQPAYSKPCLVERSFPTAPWTTIAKDFDAPENLILHACDTGGASSGSPLLLDTERGPKVIGINVGTYVQSRTVVHQDKLIEKGAADSIANTGVAAIAFATPLATFRTARMLMSSSGLKELQERLGKLGYYKGPIDGTYGPDLRIAINAFEGATRAPQTGLASEDLLNRLRMSTANSQPAAKAR